MKNRLHSYVAAILIPALVATTLPPPARADVVPTATVTATAARERVVAALARAEVRAQLETLGVRSDEVRARVEALTDEEVAGLADRLESLPAGGDGIVGAIVLVFLILLLTDIVGLTKVFPFTRSIK